MSATRVGAVLMAAAFTAVAPPVLAADETSNPNAVVSSEEGSAEPQAGRPGGDRRGGVLRGRVTDPSGAAVPKAVVEATGPSGARKASSDSSGTWQIERLQPGDYLVTVAREGFETAARTDVKVVLGRETELDTALSIAPVRENMTITESRGALGLAADQAAGAIVIEGAELEALPDDPDELADALQALAGSSAGPNGGQVFVDGFSGGRLPPKATIARIRINSTPFSAEYDRPGFGRIEIQTKPGTEKYRGQASVRFNDSMLNTKDPFATTKPDYRRVNFEVEGGGPLIKNRASFFVDVERRSVDDAQLVNATVVGPAFTLVPFNDTIVRPQTRTEFSPRVDVQLGTSHTMTLRYGYNSNEQNDTGVGGFSLPTRGYDVSASQQLLQVGETAVFGKVVNELRVQWTRQERTQTPHSLAPTIQVQDAFTGGGAGTGLSSSSDDRYEIHDIVTWAKGTHSLRAGGRVRGTKQGDVSRQGFNGTVTFAGTFGPELDSLGRTVLDAAGNPTMVPITSAERYRRTLLLGSLGYSPEAIRALGGGASQMTLSGGDPFASVRQWDFAGFVQDDWKLRKDVTLGLGLRLETQTNLSSHVDLAPRLSASWSPGYSGRGVPKTVFRLGAGMFYDRVDDGLVLEARRYDGNSPRRFVVTNLEMLDLIAYDVASGLATLPSFEALETGAQPQVVRLLAGDLRAPATLQLSLGVDRTLPGNFTVNAMWLHSDTSHALRSRVVPAPESAAAFGSAVAYQYESSGRYRQDQLILGVNRRFDDRFMLSLRYFLGRARSNTDGAGSFPSDSGNASAEWARASNDVRHRVMLMGSITLPGEIRVNPFVIASTGGPFNITTGRDLNGDTVFNDRPAYATDPTRLGVVDTEWGLLDPNPLPGAVIVPRNLGQAPGFVSANLRVSRTVRLRRSKAAEVRAPEGERPGERPDRPGMMGPPPGAGGPGGHGPGGGPGGFGGRGGGFHGPGEGSGPGLTISLSAQNFLNRVNRGAPVGNISSPSFGQSLASAGGFGRGPGGGGGGAGNRVVELQLRASF